MKLHKSQLAPYLELNGNDTFDALNPVKDIIRELILNRPPLEPDAYLKALDVLITHRSSPILGEIHLEGTATITASLRVTWVDAIKKLVDSRVPAHATEIVVVNRDIESAIVPGSFVLMTKNYPDVFCDTGKWYSLVYDAGTGILDVIAR